MKRFLLLIILFLCFSPLFLEAQNEDYEDEETYKIEVIETEPNEDAEDDEDAEKEEITTKGVLEITYDGMVPCGRCLPVTVDSVEEGNLHPLYSRQLDFINTCKNSMVFDGNTSANTNLETYIPCTFCHLFIVFDRVVSFFLTLLIPALAFLVIVGSGVILIISTDNPGLVEKAKSTLKAAVIGLVLAYLSWAIIALLLSTFMDWDIEWSKEGLEIQHMCEASIERVDLEDIDIEIE